MSKNKNETFLYAFFSFAIYVNFLRITMILNAYIIIGRLPNFMDAFTTKTHKAIPLPNFVNDNWRPMELVLAYGHFFSFIILFACIIYFFKNKYNKILIYGSIILFLIDLLVRYLPAYSYVMARV